MTEQAEATSSGARQVVHNLLSTMVAWKSAGHTR